MRGPSRNNAIRFKSLEKELAKRAKTYGRLDLIAFGFPCQDISNANPKGKGISGEKSSVFFECMRITKLLNPSWLLIENVPRLLSINEGRDFATVLKNLSESGYGYSWRVLDSQYFGVAQRRKRIFIVGRFGGSCPPEILFEQACGSRHDPALKEVGPRGLCISTKCGDRQDPTAETFIASTIRVNRDGQGSPFNFGGENIVAQTIGATPRGNASFVWQDTHIAQAHPHGKRSPARPSKGLDARRGILIGNAVTVQVAEWIARRIYNYEKSNG
ncbi:MAG TPA: DNA (cytosine-5-)-methyltransferase [Candidatus Omnitrophota bacterium]|nr:DNA (cytosine-5-)-methyltransferase [Candidatus Omnitrophota bacterium]